MKLLMRKIRMKIILTIAIISLSIKAIFSACPKDTSIWCQSSDIAKDCGVFDACLKHIWKPINPFFDNTVLSINSASDLVNLTLYYETLCPDCRAFMTGQLWKAYQEVSSIMNLTVVPYGNAKETWRNETKLWEFYCQHGPDECFGNTIHSCLLYYRPATDDHLPFIHCMESNNQDSVQVAAEKCGQQLNVDLTDILSCAQSRLGNSLQHEMALLTEALNPPHKYVPWVTLNGVHTEQIEQQAESDLVGLICDTYQGSNKPDACKKAN